MLKEIDAAKAAGLRGNEYHNRITTCLSKYLRLQTEEDIKKDIVSHFVLRLAYCKSGDRKWFIRNEEALLQYVCFDSRELRGT